MEKPLSPEPTKRRPRRLRTVALLPTLITLGNGVCGVVAILSIGIGLDLPEGKDGLYFQRAAWLILAAMIFDALDGFVARVTKTASAFGAQLDSLCDLVTFGVAPAFLAFAVSRGTGLIPDKLIIPVCVLYAMCALIRLARFTVETSPDESAHREFAGLPSPAAAGVIASAVLPVRGLRRYPELAEVFTEVILGALPGLAFALGVLMVSRLRYAHVVNRLLRGKRPFVTLVEIALVGALASFLHEFVIFLGFFGYALTGPLLWLKKRFFRRPAAGVTPAAWPEAHRPAPTPPGRDEPLT